MDENQIQDPHAAQSGAILPINMEETMKKSFIAYAMSVITSRALPDVRDGLKPVHRRILYSMDELGLQPDKPFRKSARIVGDCLGKYHPHGDSSVYGAMVRMAQDFSMRYTLVQGHGNFGSVDGDGAAAMRYTEARLSKLSSEMLRDIEKETVDFRANFDESLQEPTVLPSRYPNLLVNGSGGIAVGMTTNIPPHNLGEIIDATVAMIDNPEIEVDELIRLVPGPDFPTGASIMGTNGIRESYRSGRGRIIMRAKSEIEPFGPGGTRSRIIITEIPYQVNKARLVEKIAELVHEKRVDGITGLRDESGRDGMRVVIELRKDVNAAVILNQLYKHTQLQETFGCIMLALVNGEPKILSLAEMLGHYIAHQEDVVTRRTRYDLARAEARAHILAGLIIALDNIDEVVAIIRASANGSEAKTRLEARFGLSEKQSQAILDMRLQRLTGLERDKILEEQANVLVAIAEYTRILGDHSALMALIKDELLDIRRRFADERRTEIVLNYDDIDIEDLIDEDEMAVTMTRFGYIKRTPSSTYRTQKRGGLGVGAATVRDEDFVTTLFVTSTHNPILFFTNYGRAFSIKCYQIPEAGRNAKGTPIVNLLQLQEGEKVTACFPLDEAKAKYLVLCTRNGVIKKTPLSEFANMRKTGLIAQNLRDDDALISVLTSTGDDQLIVATADGMSIRFSEDDIRSMGRTAAGVRAIQLREGDRVIAMDLIDDSKDVLTVTELGMGKRSSAKEYRMQKRGGKGIAIMSVTEKTGRIASLHVTTPGIIDENEVEQAPEDLMLIRDDGTLIRIRVGDIRRVGRHTQGVRLMRIHEDGRVVSAAAVPHEEDEEETEIEVLLGDSDEVIVVEEITEDDQD